MVEKLRGSLNPGSSAMKPRLLQPPLTCTRLVHDSCRCAEIVRSCGSWLSNSARSVALIVVGRHRAERSARSARSCVGARRRREARLILRIVQRRELIGVVALRQLDVEDFARLRRAARRRLALRVEPVVHAVGELRRAADDRVDAVELDDLVEVVDRRRALMSGTARSSA